MLNRGAMLCLGLLLALVGISSPQSNYKMVSDVVSLAGGNMRGESDHYRLQDAIGQPSPVGGAGAGNLVMSSGFLVAEEKLGGGVTSADFNGDGTVDFNDFFLFADAFGEKQFEARFDLTSDGAVNFADFFIFADKFGKKDSKPVILTPKQLEEIQQLLVLRPGVRPLVQHLWPNSFATLAAPPEWMLEQNFPNPANPSTNIGYSLASDGPVELRVYNMLGQVIRTLVDEHQMAGNYAVQWDGKDEHGLPVASGAYLYRLQAGKYVETRQLLLLR